MNLESQVTNIELSKKLFELGFKQESLFYWCKNEGDMEPKFIEYEEMINGHIYQDYPNPIKCLSAFTSSELLESLPPYLHNDEIVERENCLGIDKLPNGQIQIMYYNKVHPIQDDNLCNALAKMLIHLIENKLIEVNK